MTNYEIIALNEDDNFIWGVKERQTDQIIDTFVFMDDAEDYLDFLEEGGGFDGFTPSFILNAVKVPESLDDTFSRKFDVT